MINKVTNTHCSSKCNFFFYKRFTKAKTISFQEFQIRFFSHQIRSVLQRFSEDRMTTDFWGAPSRQDEHQGSLFYVKLLHFFPREVRGQYFDWKRRFMSSGQELTRKSLPWQNSRWLSPLFSQYGSFLD